MKFGYLRIRDVVNKYFEGNLILDAKELINFLQNSKFRKINFSQNVLKKLSNIKQSPNSHFKAIGYAGKNNNKEHSK